MLAYFNSATLIHESIKNVSIESYALDLLAYFNCDGHIMLVGIALQWFIM
jgi:hypothetical protein